MNKTKIEWVKNPDGSHGYSWNPIKGLCPVGCWYCYAKKIYQRFGLDKLRKGKFNQNGLAFDPEAIDPIPKKSSGIFVCSTMELFHPLIPKGWKDAIFSEIEHASQHRFYILTKFPRNIDRPMPDNVYLGVTVTKWADVWRITELEKKEARIKFVSYEPLLDSCMPFFPSHGWLNWAIMGRLTQHGHKYDPDRTQIEYFVREISHHFNIPIFLKDNLAEIWGNDLIQEMPE